MDYAPESGRIVGSLEPGESFDEVARALIEAPGKVLAGEYQLLVHSEHEAITDPARTHKLREDRIEALARGHLKRYAFRLDTEAGPRILKIAEVRSLAREATGLFSSPARSEHRLHVRARRRGLAATKSMGFLEWRYGPRLLRAVHLQRPLKPDSRSLAQFLKHEMTEHGDAALDPVAHALAALHEIPFFHADIKGYHAFVEDVRREAGTPAAYRLTWIDLGRISFWMSPRKRIINLYQMLRFVVPDTETAQNRFVTAYCRATGWHADDPSRVLAKVRRFLAYKRRTVADP